MFQAAACRIEGVAIILHVGMQRWTAQVKHYSDSTVVLIGQLEAIFGIHRPRFSTRNVPTNTHQLHYQYSKRRRLSVWHARKSQSEFHGESSERLKTQLTKSRRIRHRTTCAGNIKIAVCRGLTRVETTVFIGLLSTQLLRSALYCIRVIVLERDTRVAEPSVFSEITLLLCEITTNKANITP